MTSLLKFTFGDHQIRTNNDPETPLFVAIDVVRTLGYKDAKDALARHVSPEDLSKMRILDAKGRNQLVNVINESGLYCLIFGSKLEKAKEFKRWVTSEVLPSIRKTGSYTIPSDTIDVTQQYLVRTAVSRLAKNSSLAYQRVYHELYERFKVPRYQELKKTDFISVMKFLQASDLLEGMDEPVTPPPQDGGAVLSKEEMKLIQTAVYLRSYLFKPIEEAFYHFLVSAKSPLAPRAWECFHDLNFQLLEPVLDKHGYSVKELPQYKHLVLNR